MNLFKLEVVVHIAKYKQVTAVAKAMGIKQPTVTFHMKSLEEEFGVQLFEMRTGKVLLTDAGFALLHYASKIHDLSLEARRILGEYRNLGKGTLAIGASYVPGIYILPEWTNQFSNTYPGVTVQIMIKPAPLIREMLLEHKIDIGVISSQSIDEPALHQQHICKDELVVLFTPSHPFSSLTKLDPMAIASEKFIFLGTESTTRQMTKQWAANHGVTLQGNFELDSIESIKRAVMFGQGISFISRIAVADEVQRGLLSVLPVPGLLDHRSVQVIYNRDRWRSAQLSKFLDIVPSSPILKK